MMIEKLLELTNHAHVSMDAIFLPWKKYLTCIDDFVVRLVALTVFEEDEDETDAVELL